MLIPLSITIFLIFIVLGLRKLYLNRYALLARGIISCGVPLIKSLISDNKSELMANGKVLLIRYSYAGSKYELPVPYRTSLMKRSVSNKIYLEDIKGEQYEFKQQSGIPYFCTAEELGAKNYVIRSYDDDDVSLEPNQLPFQ